MTILLANTESNSNYKADNNFIEELNITKDIANEPLHRNLTVTVKDVLHIVNNTKQCKIESHRAVSKQKKTNKTTERADDSRTQVNN